MLSVVVHQSLAGWTLDSQEQAEYLDYRACLSGSLYAALSEPRQRAAAALPTGLAGLEV